MQDEEYDNLLDCPCGYFEGKTMYFDLYVAPSSAIIFDEMLACGFRREGDVMYRALCPECKKCVPIRIRAENFIFSKSQRHLLRKNSDIKILITEDPRLFATEEKAELLRSYLSRHDDTKRSLSDTIKQLMGMSLGFAGALNMEYRLNGKLIGCALIDKGKKALSSNYFYYDISAESMKRSLGTFSILKEIELCKENALPFYYLGYYIADCKKMSYKANFCPHELRDARTGLWK